jgi:hypothetical protein
MFNKLFDSRSVLIVNILLRCDWSQRIKKPGSQPARDSAQVARLSASRAPAVGQLS